MDRRWCKLILLISFLLIPSLCFAMPLWQVGGDTPVSGGSSCSSCTPGDPTDVLCEDFDLSEYICSWTETTTDCASGYPNGDATHSGTLSCTDKGAYALEIKYAASPLTEVCSSRIDAGSAITAGHIQFYLNVIDAAIGSGSVALAQATASVDGTNDIFAWKIIYRSSTQYDLYCYCYNTSATYSSIVSISMNEGTWYGVGLTYDTNAGTAEMFIGGISKGTVSNLNNTRDPRYFFVGSVIDVEPDTDFQVDLLKWDDDTMPGACP
uniref:Putative lectin/glucanase superfamily protein n=2 Tax=viral metagenome TaxID=1070528 RepID=A0A6H1ZA02_9ZZZZ